MQVYRNEVVGEPQVHFMTGTLQINMLGLLTGAKLTAQAWQCINGNILPGYHLLCMRA